MDRWTHRFGRWIAAAALLLPLGGEAVLQIHELHAHGPVVALHADGSCDTGPTHHLHTVEDSGPACELCILRAQSTSTAPAFLAVLVERPLVAASPRSGASIACGRLSEPYSSRGPPTRLS